MRNEPAWDEINIESFDDMNPCRDCGEPTEHTYEGEPCCQRCDPGREIRELCGADGQCEYHSTGGSDERGCSGDERLPPRYQTCEAQWENCHEFTTHGGVFGWLCNRHIRAEND